MITLAVVVFALLLVTGVPLFMVFSISGLIIVLLHSGLPLYNLTIFFFDTINNYTLLAIPLFTLAGQLMVHSGMGKDLVNFLSSFVGRIPGGIAVSAIIACIFIGALTGVNFAVIATVGLILFPAMTKANYDRSYSAGLLCCASQLDALIPPSVVFIVYAVLTKSSVSKLYMAGIMPGLLLGLMLSAVAVFIAVKRKFLLTPSVNWKERRGLFIKALPALILPVIVLGGMYGGIFTATEAAAVALAYTVIVGVFIYRKLNWKNIWASSIEAARITCMILVLFCGVMLLNRAFAILGLPQAIGNWVVASGVTPLTFTLLLCVAFVALGFIMDAFAMVAIMPAVIPAIQLLGIDPIQLGVLFVTASGIGCVTPPAAGFLYFTATFLNVPTEEVLRGVWPFLLTMVIALFIFAFFPQISTWLPNTMLGAK